MEVYIVFRGRDYAGSYLQDIVSIHKTIESAEKAKPADNNWWKYFIETANVQD